MRTVIIRLFTTVMVSFVPVICSKRTLAKSRLSERPPPERDAPGRRTAGVESVATIDDETKRTEKGTKESKRERQPKTVQQGGAGIQALSGCVQGLVPCLDRGWQR